MVTADEFLTAWSAFRSQARRAVLDTGRYRMRYFTWGCGPVILFIHGMSDHATAFVMVAHRLSSRFTCVAYELPDGVTDGSRLGYYRLTDYTADAIALLDQLGQAEATLVGSSFGSILTLHSLLEAPTRFTRGVLQNGFAYRPLNRFERLLALWARYWPGWFADWPGLYECVFRRFEGPLLRSLPAPVANNFLRNGSRTPIRAAALRALTIDRTDLRPALPRLWQPLLLLTGDQDRLVPRGCWDEVVRSAPNVTRVDFERCSHYPQYTHPGAMAETIAAFLDETRSSRVSAPPVPARSAAGGVSPSGSAMVTPT